jgi:phage tail P2-like protein
MAELLPPNATSAEVALAGAVSRLSDVPVLVRDVWDPDTCPASVLPWLAWAFSVDQWDPSWSDAQKRATIKSSVSVHRYKGTIGAVMEAIAALGVDAQVQEWFNMSPPGVPYTFDLLLNASQVGASQSQLLKLLDVVDGTKNLRSHLITVIPSITSTARAYVGGVSMIGSEITVKFGGIPLLSDGTAISDGTYTSNGFKLSA